VAAVVAATLLVAELLLVGGGSFERSFPGSYAGWAAACQGRVPRADRVLLDPCVRVRGRVVTVRHQGSETHLAVIAGFHLLLVKLPAGAPQLGLGRWVDAIGALVRSRTGLREVEAWVVRR
jgi:hypothetical protein